MDEQTCTHLLAVRRTPDGFQVTIMKTIIGGVCLTGVWFFLIDLFQLLLLCLEIIITINNL